MNYNQALAIFLSVYFWSYFLIGHCLHNIPANFFSFQNVLHNGWGVRSIFASVAVLCFYLWGL